MSPQRNPKFSGIGRWLTFTVTAVALVLLARFAVAIRTVTPPAPPPSRLRNEPLDRKSASSAVWIQSSHRKHLAPAEPTVIIPRLNALQRALANAHSEKNPMQMTILMENLTATVADTEIAGILPALNNAELGTEFASLLVRRWAGTDPDGTAAWIESLPPGPNRMEMMNQLAVTWVSADPSAATAWLEKLPDSSAKTAATMALSAELARTDQRSALQIASALPVSTDRDNLITHVVGEWAANDPQTAFAWVGRIENQSLRERLVGALAEAVAKTDGAGAANLVANNLSPGDSQAQAAVAVALRWGQIEPESATDWVRRFPEGPTRQIALENLASFSRLRNQPPAAP